MWPRRCPYPITFSEIMEGGYDYKFMDFPPERLVCKICLLPSRDPYLSLCCGHTFCKECSNVTRRVTRACPMCRKKRFPVVKNKQADREIKSLRVVCTNQNSGCKWQGELNDINSHLGNNDGCQFQTVECSNECGKTLQQRYLTNHLETECPCRQVGCYYCHNVGEYQFIMGEHGEQCPKLPLPCPNGCEVGSVPREDMENHKEVCQLQDVVCPKCRKILQRQHLISHVITICPYRIVDCRYCRISESINLFEVGSTEQYVPSFPYLVPTSVRLGVYLVNTWKHTGRSVLLR